MMLGCLLPPHHYHHVPVTSLGRNTCFNTYSEYSLKMRQINATLNFISDLILIFDKKRPFTNHFLVLENLKEGGRNRLIQFDLVNPV